MNRRGFEEVLATDDQMVVIACSEPMRAGRLLVHDGVRMVVRQELTGEQYRSAVQRNRAVREKHGQVGGQWLAEGDRADTLATISHPTEAPSGCEYFYWVERW